MTEKPWYTSRTLWLNVIAIVVFGLGLLIEQAAVFRFSPQTIAIFGIVVGVLNYILRLDTAAPIAGTPAATRHAVARSELVFDSFVRGREGENDDAQFRAERQAASRAETKPHGIARQLRQDVEPE